MACRAHNGGMSQRIHLGALWSGSITRKADHRIVDTGPYGVVRHPIYTGLIAAAIAMAAVKATPVAFACSIMPWASR